MRFTTKSPSSVSVKANTLTPVTHANVPSSLSSKENVSPVGTANVTSGTESAVMTRRSRKSRATPAVLGGKLILTGSGVFSSTRVTLLSWSPTAPSVTTALTRG